MARAEMSATYLCEMLAHKARGGAISREFH